METKEECELLLGQVTHKLIAQQSRVAIEQSRMQELQKQLAEINQALTRIMAMDTNVNVKGKAV